MALFIFLHVFHFFISFQWKLLLTWWTVCSMHLLCLYVSKSVINMICLRKPWTCTNYSHLTWHSHTCSSWFGKHANILSHDGLIWLAQACFFSYTGFLLLCNICAFSKHISESVLLSLLLYIFVHGSNVPFVMKNNISGSTFHETISQNTFLRTYLRLKKRLDITLCLDRTWGSDSSAMESSHIRYCSSS